MSEQHRHVFKTTDSFGTVGPCECGEPFGLPCPDDAAEARALRVELTRLREQADLRQRMIDIPTAWSLCSATPQDQHHEQCSYRTAKGGLLCDCAAMRVMERVSGLLSAANARAEAAERVHGHATDEPNPNGSTHARLNWWKAGSDVLNERLSEAERVQEGLRAERERLMALLKAAEQHTNEVSSRAAVVRADAEAIAVKVFETWEKTPKEATWEQGRERFFSILTRAFQGSAEPPTIEPVKW